MMLSHRCKDTHAVVPSAIVYHKNPSASKSACEDCL
jgi:hypothetical protein